LIDSAMQLWIVGVALVSLLPVLAFKGRGPRLAFLTLAAINTTAFATLMFAIGHDVESIALVGAFVMIGLTTAVLLVMGIGAGAVRAVGWALRRLPRAG
jgi:hypothetical protein